MGWSALREKHGYRLAGRYWPGFLLLVDTFADWFGSHGLLSFVCDHEDVMGSYVYIHIYTMASERVNEYQRSAVRGGLFLTNESFRLLACLLDEAVCSLRFHTFCVIAMYSEVLFARYTAGAEMYPSHPPIAGSK
jgi:hypothetical protein